MFWFWLTISGTAQIIGVLCGIYCGNDIKWLIPYVVYGIMNVIVGTLGILGK